MAATGTGQEVRQYPRANLTGTTVDKTAAWTVTVAQLQAGTVFTNTGAVGTIVFTLPAIATVGEACARFRVKASQIIRVTPASGEKIYLDGSGVADKYLQIPGTAEGFAEICAIDGDWVVMFSNALCTKQA